MSKYEEKNIETKLRGLSLQATKLVPAFVDTGCHVVSVMERYDRISRFLNQIVLICCYETNGACAA
jgi:hypothetical protein